MTRLNTYYADWTQARVGASLAGITAAALSDALQSSAVAAAEVGYPYYPRALRVAILLTGTITNDDISVSIGITDAKGVEFWTVPQTQLVRTLPIANTVVVGIFTFDTLHAVSARIALETAITGGGNAKIYYCFQEGDVRA